MPCIGVDGESPQRIMESACVSKHGNAAQQAVAHEKCQKGQPGVSSAEPRINQKYIHGDTAQLERKIPPDIFSAADGNGKGKLFPYLAAEHQYAADKEKDIGFIIKIGKF